MESTQIEAVTLRSLWASASPAMRIIFFTRVRTWLGTALLASYALWMSMQILWTSEKVNEEPPLWTLAAKQAAYSSAAGEVGE